jgi:hypothetical protein
LCRTQRWSACGGRSDIMKRTTAAYRRICIFRWFVKRDSRSLQLDNTSRENRNSILFGFMAYLKLRGVFKVGCFSCELTSPQEILVSFLPIGHTHNEPDQVASRCSVACRTQDITTLDRLHEVLTHCYHYKKNQEVVVELVDVSAIFRIGCAGPVEREKAPRRTPKTAWCTSTRVFGRTGTCISSS